MTLTNTTNSCILSNLGKKRYKKRRRGRDLNPCEARASPALVEPKRYAQGWRRSPLGYLGRRPFFPSQEHACGRQELAKYRRDQPSNTISMLMSFGTCILISCLKALSSASRSIRRLCTRISQCSHVAVPSPSGLFLVGTRSLFVGRGTGPDRFTPVLSAMLFT